MTVDSHPLLEADIFSLEWPSPLGGIATPPGVIGLLDSEASAPMERSEEIRAEARNLLRVGGFKPTGRSKPASEYLVKAAEAGRLTAINIVVDICNVVSLHSGLPVSVVDQDLAEGPFRIGLAQEGEHYVFNASGQTIDVGGLLCLHDQRGPCANGVKDCQRTKTHDGTTTTLIVVWGTLSLPGRAALAGAWFRSLAQSVGAREIR